MSFKLYPDNALKIRLDNVRCAFPVLNAPEQFNGEGKARYSFTAIIDGADKETIAKIHEIALAAVVAEVGPTKAPALMKTLVANNKTAYGDGEKKANYEGYAGNFFVSAHSQTAPTLLDNVAGADGKPQALVRPQNRIYSGSRCNVVMAFYYQSKYQRLCASFSGVQFLCDDDAFSGTAPASSDEFEAVAPAEDADLG